MLLIMSNHSYTQTIKVVIDIFLASKLPVNSEYKSFSKSTSLKLNLYFLLISNIFETWRSKVFYLGVITILQLQLWNVFSDCYSCFFVYSSKFFEAKMSRMIIFGLVLVLYYLKNSYLTLDFP